MQCSRRLVSSKQDYRSENDSRKSDKGKAGLSVTASQPHGDEPVLLGSILIYVDGYGVDDFRCAELNLGHKFSQPEPGDMFWFNDGWAVGNNARDRYCSRNASDKVRRFKSYDEAVDYIFRKQRKRPQERFSLVYELDRTLELVSSLDEILEIDAKAKAEEQAQDAYRRQQKELREIEFPGLDILRDRVGLVVANNAAELLGLLRNEGETAARARFSKATYYRLKGILKNAGLIGE